MNEPLVKIEHLGKKFCRRLKRSLWYGVKDMAQELSHPWLKSFPFAIFAFLAVKDQGVSNKVSKCGTDPFMTPSPSHTGSIASLFGCGILLKD